MVKKIRLVALGWLFVVALGGMMANPAGASGDPVIGLSSITAKPGDQVIVSLSGWPIGPATVSVCGNNARRGSQDCSLLSSAGVGIADPVNPTTVGLIVDRPPMPCPCVVRVATQSDAVVRSTAINIAGIPSAPTIGPNPVGPVLQVTAKVTKGSSSLLDSLRGSLGGRVRRQLVLVIRNLGTKTADRLRASAAVGRSANSGESLTTPAVGPIPPGEARPYIVPVALSAPSYGRYTVSGTVAGDGAPIAFEVPTSTTPVLLVVVMVGLVADIGVFVLLRIQRSRGPLAITTVVNESAPLTTPALAQVPAASPEPIRVSVPGDLPAQSAPETVSTLLSVPAKRGAEFNRSTIAAWRHRDPVSPRTSMRLAPPPALVPWPSSAKLPAGPVPPPETGPRPMPHEPLAALEARSGNRQTSGRPAPNGAVPHPDVRSVAPADEAFTVALVTRQPPITGADRPDAFPVREPRFFQSRRAALVTCSAVAALLIIVYLVATPPSSSGSGTAGGDRKARAGVPPRPGGTTDTSVKTATGAAQATTNLQPTSPTPGAPGGPSTTTPPVIVPATIQVDGNTGATDGQAVKVRITAKTGSQVFGFEIRLCAGGAAFRFDSDFRPTQGGQCLSKPLSTASEFDQEVRAAPPFTVAETTFRVGVGTEHFVTSTGQPVTINCGPAHPCQIALKIQYPDGFAFRSYPVTYR